MGTVPGTIICMGTQNLKVFFLDGHRNRYLIMMGTWILLTPQNSVQVRETQVSGCLSTSWSSPKVNRQKHYQQLRYC